MTRYVAVANPGSPRARLFEEAVRAEEPEATLEIVSWLEIARGQVDLAERLPHQAALRIESAGQDPEVERALLELGHDARAAEGAGEIVAPAELAQLGAERGRIFAPRQVHLGFLRVLERIERALAARPDVHVMTAPSAIRDLFDKRVTSALYERAGIPVPRRLDGVVSSAELSRRMLDEGVATVFVKVATSSSASCLAVVQRSGERLVAQSTVQTSGVRRYNSRRLVRYSGEPASRLVDFLVGEGAIVERLVPKARLPRAGSRGPGPNYDLRVLVVAGEPALVVGRASSHPVTNLHLGGTRIPEEVVRAHVDPARWDGAMNDAVRAAGCHDALYVGVDLAFVARGPGHVVFEANAFGDHLNDVSRDGLGPHRLELRAFARRRSSTSEVEGARSSTPSPKVR